MSQEKILYIYGKVNTGEFQKGWNISQPEGFIPMLEDKPITEGNWIAQEDGTWSNKQLTLHDQATQLSMNKFDFVEMAEALTVNMPNPVTWAGIRLWMNDNPEIDKLFTLATHVYRNDPKLDEVTAMFGAEFLPFLDLMFVYQNEIKAEMALAKAENRAINLDAYIPQGVV